MPGKGVGLELGELKGIALMEYPDGIDLVWLAADAQGRLAAMITAGAGPMPASVLKNIETEIETALLALPDNGHAILRCTVPDPSSFLALGNRGLFVYDWTDIHRTNATASGSYELVAQPGVPITLDALSPELRRAAIPLGREVTFGSAHLQVG